MTVLPGALGLDIIDLVELPGALGLDIIDLAELPGALGLDIIDHLQEVCYLVQEHLGVALIQPFPLATQANQLDQGLLPVIQAYERLRQGMAGF